MGGGEKGAGRGTGSMQGDRDDSNTVSASLGEVREFHTKNLGLGVSRLGSDNDQLHP